MDDEDEVGLWRCGADEHARKLAQVVHRDVPRNRDSCRVTGELGMSLAMCGEI